MRATRRAFSLVVREFDGLLLIVGAGSFLVLDVLGLDVERYLPNLTLALFALIGVALLRDRRKATDPHRLGEIFKWRDDVLEIQQLVDNSSEVWLWGATLSSHMPMLRDTLRRRLTEGLRVRILMADVTGPSADSLVTRAVPAPSDQNTSGVREYLERRAATGDAIRRRSMNILADLNDLRNQGGAIEYRVLDYLGPYLLYVFNPSRRDASILVSLATHDGTEDRFTLWVKADSDPEVFEHFKRQFEAVWRASAMADQDGDGAAPESGVPPT